MVWNVTACTVLVDGFSLISDSPDMRRRTRQHLRGHGQSRGRGGRRRLSPGLSTALLATCPAGAERAMNGSGRSKAFSPWAIRSPPHQVTFAIEPLNRFETYFLNTAADAAQLAEQIGHPNIGILFDTFHANIEEKNIAAGYRTVGPYLKHVHTCENDRGIPGSGHVEWKQVFQALRSLNYDGWLTIESFGFALKELSAAAAIWRDIERTPESIAFEGVKFLKRQVAAVLNCVS